MKGLVLLSGGIDSTTLLGLAKNECDEVLAISFLYGQKHKVELQSAKNVALYYKVKQTVVNLPDIFKGGNSALMDGDVEIPHKTYAEQDDGPVSTVVPFRNANLISVATTIAIVNNCDVLYVGVHADDSLNWAYPDCSPEFIGAMSNAVYVGSYNRVRLKAPFVFMQKKDIVKLGLELEVPYQLTHSCYEGVKPACGVCATCRDRKQAFLDNGVNDPIEYVE